MSTDFPSGRIRKLIRIFTQMTNLLQKKTTQFATIDENKFGIMEKSLYICNVINH